jgi:hypothetical protein
MLIAPDLRRGFYLLHADLSIFSHEVDIAVSVLVWGCPRLSLGGRFSWLVVGRLGQVVYLLLAVWSWGLDGRHWLHFDRGGPRAKPAEYLPHWGCVVELGVVVVVVM